MLAASAAIGLHSKVSHRHLAVGRRSSVVGLGRRSTPFFDGEPGDGRTVGICSTGVHPAAARLRGVTAPFDVAVVGLGLVGSAALRALAADGLRCVGVGPAEPGDLRTHDGPFASHYDSGRITRHLDPIEEWAVLAARSIAGYPRIEAASGIRFHFPSGAVLAELDPVRIDAIRAVATQLSVATTEVAPADADRLDPRLRFPAGSTLLAEPAPAGHVDPRRMLAAQLAAATATGAGLAREPALAVERSDHSERWRVVTATRVAEAERLVVATGAHTDELGLDGCPSLRVRGETIVTAVLDDGERRRLAGMPAVLARLHGGDHADLYVVPPTDYPDGTTRLKLGATLRRHRRLDDGASRREWMAGDAHRDEAPALERLLTDLVADLRVERWDSTPCLITDTASRLPIVDHLAPGLVLAAGGNGFAAKSANAIGELAARLAVDGRWTDHELDPRRFSARR